MSKVKIEEAQRLTPEEKEAVNSSTERGVSSHIKSDSLSRRGFIQAMALMGGVATTLALPTGVPKLKEAVNLPWVKLPELAGGGVTAKPLSVGAPWNGQGSPAGTSIGGFEITDQFIRSPENRCTSHIQDMGWQPWTGYSANSSTNSTKWLLANDWRNDFRVGALSSAADVGPLSQYQIYGSGGMNNRNSGGPFVWDTEMEGLVRSPVGSWGTYAANAKSDAEALATYRQNYTPEQNTQMVKKVGKYNGFELVSVSALDRRFVYSTWQNNATGGRLHDPGGPGEFPNVFSDDGVVPDESQYDGGTCVFLHDANNTRIFPKTFQWVVTCDDPWEFSLAKMRPSAMGSTVATEQYARRDVYLSKTISFIRAMGYNATMSHMTMCRMTYQHQVGAVDSGIANRGRGPTTYNPEYGLTHSMCCILTDMPLVADQPIDLGFAQFCQSCNKCSRLCPQNAISSETLPTDGSTQNDVGAPNCLTEPRTQTVKGTSYGDLTYHLGTENPGTVKYYTNFTKCMSFQTSQISPGTDPGCCMNGLCQNVCPFNKPPDTVAPEHDVTRWAIKNVPELDSFWPWLDDALGYGYPASGVPSEQNGSTPAYKVSLAEQDDWWYGTQLRVQRMAHSHLYF